MTAPPRIVFGLPDWSMRRAADTVRNRTTF